MKPKQAGQHGLGTPSYSLRSPPHLPGMEAHDETVIYDTDLTDKIRPIVGLKENEGLEVIVLAEM